MRNFTCRFGLGAVFALAALLAACASAGPGVIPQSGVSGNEGGSELALYFAQSGLAHFHP